MSSLFVLYSALAAFGIGVTVVDMLGVFDHNAGHDSDDSPDSDGGEDSSDDDGAPATRTDGRGSYIASGDSSARVVAKTIGVLRAAVYFSLGAGPTGLFATLLGKAPLEGLLWSAGAGLCIAALSRLIRSLVRKDLDSSIEAGEFIMTDAVVSVPLSGGSMGKAIVRQYGREAEVYIRSKDPKAVLLRNDMVRIIDFDDDCYWVEKN